MKRFKELTVDIRKKYPADDFFADFESARRAEPARGRHYRSYNDALMSLDKESWKILKGKAIEQFGNEREGQRKQGLFNQLNEAFAYRYLVRQGFKKVRFIEEGRRKRPDIRFVDGRKERYCEVKTLGVSDAEIKRRASHGVYDGRVYLGLTTGFLNKLGADINRAWQQIHSAGETGVVFILVRFDDIALDYYARYREQLVEFCRSQGFNNLIIKIGHRGNKRICICD